MTQLIFRLFLSFMVFYSTTAYANEPILKLKDLSIFADDTESFRLVSKNETIIMKKISANRVSINSMEVSWTQNDSFASVQKKMTMAYQKSKKKSALLERLIIGEAHAAPPLLFTLLFGGMLGAGIGRATCASNSHRSTASEKKGK